MNTYYLKRNISFSPALISKYRTELMGYGILFIMLSHSISNWMQIPIAGQIVGKMTALVHTQGFFFLSGFGLYFSFVKNNNIAQFYKRRVLRMYIPFLLMSFPLYIFSFIVGREAIGYYLLKQSALDFYICGGAMWYISATLFLYMIFPFLYEFLFCANFHVRLKIVSCLVIWLIVTLCLYQYNWGYYHQIEKLIIKFPMFLLGIYTGYIVKNNKRISLRQMVGLFLLFCVLFVSSKYYLDLKMYYWNIVSLFGIVCITILLKITNGGGKIGATLKWLGKYSLELYIFHMLIRMFFVELVELCGYEIDLTVQRIIVPLSLLSSLLICKPVHDGIEIILNKIR